MIQSAESAYHYMIRPECETNYFVHGNAPNYSPANVTVFQNPIPIWIQPMAHPEPVDIDSDNQRANPYLLLDYQLDIASQTYYDHAVFKIWNVFDLENLSNLSINFNPAFETLTLHECKILRNGEWINRLDMNELRVIQKEEDLEDNIYSAHLSALLFLEDIREGNILDYSYSISRSSDPRFSYRCFLQDTCQWEQYSLRVVKPPNRSFQTKIFPPDWGSHLSENDNEILWKMKPCPSCKCEPDQPPGYRSIAQFEISEFLNWNDAASVIVPYYQLSDDFKRDAEVLQLAEQWKEKGATLEEQALRAIRYVQDEIRYTGIEVGVSGYQPTDPLATLKRRFGDCKGKAQLLRAFLNLLGIHSDVCLVSTHLCGSVKNCLPSLKLFNHAILRIDLDDIVAFVDATAVYMGGDLSQMGCPFGAGLIVSEKTEDLTTIPVPTIHPEVECHTTFEINDEDAVQMSSVVHFYGSQANHYRNILKGAGLNQMIEPFQQYIKTFFQEFEPLSPVQIEDDRQNNHLTLIATLRLDRPWTCAKKKSNKYICFAPYFLTGYFNQYVDTDRETPLKLTSSRIRESISVKGGYLLNGSETIERDFFTFRSTVSGCDKIEYELITHLDQLAPEDLESYEEALEEGLDELEVVIKRR